jgi:hypothetical protein
MWPLYTFFSQISAWLSEPFGNVATSTNFALLSVLFLVLSGQWRHAKSRRISGRLPISEIDRAKPDNVFLVFRMGDADHLEINIRNPAAMPLLLFAGLAVGVGFDRVMAKRARHWGVRIQRLAGTLFILLGISDTLTYWTM